MQAFSCPSNIILPSIATSFDNGSNWNKECGLCDYRIFFNFGTGKEFLSVTDPKKKFTDPFITLPAFSPSMDVNQETKGDTQNEEIFACPNVKVMINEIGEGWKHVAHGQLSVIRDPEMKVRVMCDDKLITEVSDDTKGKIIKPKTVQFLGNGPYRKIFVAVFQSDMTGSLFLSKLNNATKI